MIAQYELLPQYGMRRGDMCIQYKHAIEEMQNKRAA